jgi:hypothetical protein
MNYLFANAPLFVPGMKMKDYDMHDLERRVEDLERKSSVTEIPVTPTAEKEYRA